MIPIHDSDRTQRREIIVNHLKQLNDYDYREPHRHNYFELFFFLKGGGFHKVDFVKFDIESNSAHIIAPGQVHQMKRNLDSEGFVVLFELNALEAPKEIENFLFQQMCLDASENSPCFSFSKEKYSILEYKIKNMLSLYEEKLEIAKLSLRNEVQSFLIECMKEAEEQKKPIVSIEYFNFRKLLHANFSKMKKVKEYAEALHLTEKTLNEIVKKHTGESTSNIIYKQIIIEAKRLLNTGISIKETAYALNFDDPGHFSKFFKTKTNLSPSEFQNYT
ncbi:MAG: helix-turn-helix transcriptional regulator [Crocinitomicaceae bacterium]|nr:helix-turn-helix transcriptional regulator [Crocinitomicaceae bacterium]